MATRHGWQGDTYDPNKMYQFRHRDAGFPRDSIVYFTKEGSLAQRTSFYYYEGKLATQYYIAKFRIQM